MASAVNEVDVTPAAALPEELWAELKRERAANRRLRLKIAGMTRRLLGGWLGGTFMFVVTLWLAPNSAIAGGAALFFGVLVSVIEAVRWLEEGR